MSKKTRAIPAAEFKSKCLALLDEVAKTGKPVVITKRGRPVAKLVPAKEPNPVDLRGSILWQGDLISPIDESWDAES